MKTTSIAILLLSAAALAAPAARAATHVSRCTTADGGSSYTDGSCRALGARPVPMSANLMRSLARAGALGDEGFRPSVAPAHVAIAGDNATHRLGDASCPRTPQQLATALRSSLGDGQVSRLASLYDWSGTSSRQAKPILDRLERMSERPLLDGQYFATGGSGTVQLVQGARNAPTVTEVAVNRRAGCLLLAL